MLRIKNFIKNDNIIAYDYYCEDNMQDKGHVEYDLEKNQYIKQDFAPSENNQNIYCSISVEFARKMIETNETERVFIWY